jgi:hypothetical protein
MPEPDSDGVMGSVSASTRSRGRRAASVHAATTEISRSPAGTLRSRVLRIHALEMDVVISCFFAIPGVMSASGVTHGIVGAWEYKSVPHRHPLHSPDFSLNGRFRLTTM